MRQAPRLLPTIGIYCAACTALLVFCGPIAWMLAGSFKGSTDTFIHPYDVLPRHFSFSAYGDALHGGTFDNVKLARDFINSTIYAGVSMLSNVIPTSIPTTS